MSDTPFWVPIVSGAVGILIGVVYKAKVDRAGRYESESRSERFDTYKRIIALLLSPDEGEMAFSRKQLAVDIGLFASDEVARTWIAFLDHALEGNANDSPEAAVLWQRMLLAIRRDSSRPHTKLNNEDTFALLGIRPGRDAAVARANALKLGLGKPRPGERSDTP